ncbi:MAG: PCMD domain-containing protein [Prevotellaceae bacterium]|nr:PCMD domain-containing protein [Prevotellaceae bacterium]
MKHLKLLLGIAVCGTLVSCFKDEPLNTECDIEQAYIHSDTPETMFYNVSDSLVNVLSSESTVRFSVREGVDLTALAPHFIITEGATISPESGSVQDFSNGGVAYKVTSQDGEWSRNYTVTVSPRQLSDGEYDEFDFENFRLESTNSKYYVWSAESSDNSSLDDWATGNPGFAISMSTAAPEDYPTVPLENGYEGYGVKLTTRSTGPLGSLVSKPIAAGNLFIGKFDVTKALTNTLQTTMFGKEVAKKPLTFTGYYTYKPGDTFTDKDGNTVAGKTDCGNIYAVLYKNTDNDGNPIVLYGDNVKTSEQIVALADLGNTETTSEWTYFSINFDYSSEIDSELLANYGYNLAIVCTSSNDGASFQGAIGSTLTVDKLRIIWDINSDSE